MALVEANCAILCVLGRDQNFRKVVRFGADVGPAASQLGAATSAEPLSGHGDAASSPATSPVQPSPRPPTLVFAGVARHRHQANDAGHESQMRFAQVQPPNIGSRGRHIGRRRPGHWKVVRLQFAGAQRRPTVEDQLDARAQHHGRAAAQQRDLQEHSDEPVDQGDRLAGRAGAFVVLVVGDQRRGCGRTAGHLQAALHR